MAELCIDTLFLLLHSECGFDELCDRLIVHGLVSLLLDIIERPIYHDVERFHTNTSEFKTSTSLSNGNMRTTSTVIDASDEKPQAGISRDEENISEHFKVMRLICWSDNRSVPIVSGPDLKHKVVAYLKSNR